MNLHHCPKCGWETKAPAHVLLIFHPCRPAGRRVQLTRRPRISEPLPDVTTDDERTAWFASRYPIPEEQPDA